MRVLTVALALVFAGPVHAISKTESCDYQAAVVNAVKDARLARVKERDVETAVLATEPDWPEKFNKVIPLVTPWIYEMKRRDVRDQDLGAAWIEFCLQQ